MCRYNEIGCLSGTPAQRDILEKNIMKNNILQNFRNF